MPPDRPSIAGRSPADRTAIAPRSRASRSATTNGTSRHGRTAEGRRVRDLYVGYLAALGNPTDVPTLALVLAAAEAVALTEVARRECLAGMTGVNAELTIRFENTAARALRRLGLNKPVPVPRKTFHEKMAEREAAQKAAEAKAAATSDQRTDEAGEAAGGAT
jgi:hypothetical protein